MSTLPAEPAEALHVPHLRCSGTQDEDSMVQCQDDAEAILQPALSAQARHLTSLNTPAIEKVAALDKAGSARLFDISSDADSDSNPEPTTSPEVTPEETPEGTPRAKPKVTPTLPQVPEIGRLPPKAQSGREHLPSPWQAQTKPSGPNRPSKGVLGSAFGTTRNRSRSASQDAFRRFQKALPSFNPPTHLLPSLPTSFFSSFTERTTTSSSNKPSRPSGNASASTVHRPPLQPTQLNTINPPLASTSTPRPKVLRRVTSDENILYHSLSRASSLGDDDQFMDVREMVNIRFMALKDSLPDVPNFKMPNIPKLSTQAWKSTLSLHAVDSTDLLSHQTSLSRELNLVPKEPLDRVLEELTGDVVIMGGYRGSILRSAEPPHHQVWAPVKLGLNMRKVNLEIGLEDEDEEKMEETIIPSGMLTHIGPIDISRKFIKKLLSSDNARAGKLRVWDYGYDWRLSPHLLSRKLQEFFQDLPSNQPGVPKESRGALLIAHSLGGLIARHAVNQRPELFSSVLYCGAPQRCVNILNPLRHGDAVLFNEKLLTARVNFSIRSSFVFLPEDGFCFVDKNTGEKYPINFYDANEWVKWHLSPCMAPTLPPYNRPQSSTFSSRIPKSLRNRADSRTEKQPPSPTTASRNPITLQLNNNVTTVQDEPAPSDPERERNLAYLAKTLAATHKFRSELAHSPSHQEANAYPPLAVIYSKSIPTVYAAQVTSREAIRCQDAYDDLLFRPGDGVVLAKEAMLPDGYALVRGGRVRTERGHITMMGDMLAMGRALEALVNGRRKGIGLGFPEGKSGDSEKRVDAAST